MRALRWIAVSFVLLCSVITWAAPIRADDVSGAINGFIIDYNGIPIEQATVSVYSTDVLRGPLRYPPPVARRETANGGFFTFLGLLPGRYVIIVTKEGYVPECSFPTRVVTGSLSRLTVRLFPRETMTHTQCQPYRWAEVDEGIIY